MTEINIERTEPLVDVVGFRLSWGAIFAGFVVATVTQIVLSVLGLAIGFSAWDPGADAAGGLGIGAAVWFAGTAIVSLFLGGLVLGRLAGVLKRKDGILHGIVMWGLSTLLAVWMVANGVGGLVGSTLNVLTRTTSAVVSGAVTATGQAGAAVATGQTEAATIRERVDSAYQQAQQAVNVPPMDSIREQAGEIAYDTTNVLATVAWLSLLTMGLSLGAAMWGAAITARD